MQKNDFTTNLTTEQKDKIKDTGNKVSQAGTILVALGTVIATVMSLLNSNDK